MGGMVRVSALAPLSRGFSASWNRGAAPPNFTNCSADAGEGEVSVRPKNAAIAKHPQANVRTSRPILALRCDHQNHAAGEIGFILPDCRAPVGSPCKMGLLDV